jgi:uncharacterized membrane protein YhhN
MKRKDRYHLVGWGLFLISAVFFIASGVRHRDILTLTGSIAFFIACIVFLIPLLPPGKKGN